MSAFHAHTLHFGAHQTEMLVRLKGQGSVLMWTQALRWAAGSDSSKWQEMMLMLLQFLLHMGTIQTLLVFYVSCIVAVAQLSHFRRNCFRTKLETFVFTCFFVIVWRSLLSSQVLTAPFSRSPFYSSLRYGRVERGASIKLHSGLTTGCHQTLHTLHFVACL